jgi:hypothetical protein
MLRTNLREFPTVTHITSKERGRWTLNYKLIYDYLIYDLYNDDKCATESKCR